MSRVTVADDDVAGRPGFSVHLQGDCGHARTVYVSALEAKICSARPSVFAAAAWVAHVRLAGSDCVGCEVARRALADLIGVGFAQGQRVDG